MISFQKYFLTLLIFVLVSTSAFALSENSISILTVSESDNGTLQGGVASLDLLIQEGNGAIFIESFPLSNVDTQAVTRIATDIACSYSNANCDSLDFFYTIKTNSGYVRGPSAGGATALLALATLEGVSLDDVAMTGGISSGGLITSVGGVKEKTLAATQESIETIIIPALVLNLTYNETNTTPLLLEDIQTNEQNVHAVFSLDEAYSIVTGNPLSQKSIVEPPTYYTQKMKETSQILCLRTLDLIAEVQSKGENATNISMEYYNKSILTKNTGDYYSSASYCYSANLQLRQQLVASLSQEVLLENFVRLEDSITFFQSQIDQYELETFSDLEAYIIVKERLFESKEYLDLLNTSNISSEILALGIERYYSAVAWSEFFGLEGEPLIIDETSLELACIREIREVEARSNYLKTIIPLYLLEDMTSQLSGAYKQYNEDNYPLCIFKASKAKANAHLFMNNIQDESQLDDIFAVKTIRSEELISLQEEQGTFPIIGYSYYEYAQQLYEEQPYTALLFTEYAISMADVSKYFPKARTSLVTKTIGSELFYLGLGILIGYLLCMLLGKKEEKGEVRNVKKKPAKKHSRKRK